MRWSPSKRKDYTVPHLYFAVCPRECYLCHTWFWLEQGARRWQKGYTYGSWGKHSCSDCYTLEELAK